MRPPCASHDGAADGQAQADAAVAPSRDAAVEFLEHAAPRRPAAGRDPDRRRDTSDLVRRAARAAISIGDAGGRVLEPRFRAG